MKIVSAREMQLLDRQTIEEYEISGLILMENAGLGVVRELIRRYGPPEGRRITVIAGRGNNGGDGLVIARHLHQRGARVGVLLLGRKEQVKGDAKTNLRIFEKIGGAVQELPEAISGKQKTQALREKLAESDVLIDAVFGTGLSGTRLNQPANVAGQLISLMNESGRPVVAVDIPSGVSADTGEVMGAAVKADLTVSFALPKRGHYLYPGAGLCGTLRVVDIGVPHVLIRKAPAAVRLLTLEKVREDLPARPPDAHKGTYGHVLLIAGSVGKTGAACMAALSALRAGAGLATLAAPASLNPVLEQKLTEVMTAPLPETPQQSLSVKAEKEVLELAQGKSAVILGPGLSTHPETQELVRRLLQNLQSTIVLDADGINALANHTDLLRQSRAKIILTPHPGEMARLLGVKSQNVQQDRLELSGRFAREHGLWLVLKGAHTVLAEPDGALWVNPTGNEGMASGGTGDVLSGLLGGLTAQGIAPGRAIRAGAYLHGLAGDLAAARKGAMSLIATDLVDCLPEAIEKVLHGSQAPDPYNPFSP